MRFVTSLTGQAVVAASLVATAAPAQDPLRGIPGIPVLIEGGNAQRDYRLGVQALKDRQYTAARKAFLKVLRVVETDATTFVLTGIAYAGEGNRPLARNYFESAIRADPGFVMAYQELGVLYAEGGERDKARKQLDHLNRMAESCHATCAEAQDLASAIKVVNAALGA